MGESRRRRQLDPTYVQKSHEQAAILDFFGQEWCLRRTRAQQRQAYLEMQVSLEMLAPDELQQVTAQWQSTYPRRPFVELLIHYLENCEDDPVFGMEVDDSGKLIEVLPLCDY